MDNSMEKPNFSKFLPRHNSFALSRHWPRRLHRRLKMAADLVELCFALNQDGTLGGGDFARATLEEKRMHVLRLVQFF